jgi:glycosyltransferase involved in cell wall biosynthesis
VHFVGQVGGLLKWELIRRSYLLALPSRSESFGLVVVEALMCGIPVLATQSTPWAALEEQHCGKWVPTTVDGLAIGLSELLEQPPERLAEMGRAGQAMASSQYTSERMAREFSELFESLKP